MNGDAAEPFEAEAFCTKAVDECRDRSLTKEKCLSTFEIVRVGSDCNALLAGATCADLASPTSDFTKTCFPPCSGDPSCNGTETITMCTTGGMSITVECAGVCEAAGKTYSGICGTSAHGVSSADGKAKCWCQ